MKKILAFLLCAVMTLSVCVAAFPAHAADNCTDGITPGDVNGDGEVTVADALMVLQHSVGKITLDETVLKNADVDGEEGIAVTDALAILQASVNKITLPIVK